MQVTAFKCPVTGELFEKKVAFNKHQRDLKKEQARQQARAEELEQRAALHKAVLQSSSLAEYIANINAYLLHQNKSASGRAQFVYLELDRASTPAARQDTSIRVSFRLYYRGDSFYSFPTSIGMRLGCGNGISFSRTRKEVKGATHCTAFDGYISFSEVPGLMASYEAILKGRESLNNLRAQERDAAQQLVEKTAKHKEQVLALRSHQEKIAALRVQLAKEENAARSLEAAMRQGLTKQFDKQMTRHKSQVQEQMELEQCIPVKASEPLVEFI